MNRIEELINDEIISEEYATPEFEMFMRVANKLFDDFSYLDILEYLGMYWRVTLEGEFDLLDGFKKLEKVLYDNEFTYIDYFTTTRLDNYSCLDHLSENVKKAVYLLICMANKLFPYINHGSPRYYSYLQSLNDIEEFADFMNNIPEELEGTEIVYNKEYFEKLFDKNFGVTYI